MKEVFEEKILEPKLRFTRSSAGVRSHLGEIKKRRQRWGSGVIGEINEDMGVVEPLFMRRRTTNRGAKLKFHPTERQKRTTSIVKVLQSLNSPEPLPNPIKPSLTATQTQLGLVTTPYKEFMNTKVKKVECNQSVFMDFKRDQKCIGVSYDDVERKLFHRLKEFQDRDDCSQQSPESLEKPIHSKRHSQILDKI